MNGDSNSKDIVNKKLITDFKCNSNEIDDNNFESVSNAVNKVDEIKLDNNSLLASKQRKSSFQITSIIEKSSEKLNTMVESLSESTIPTYLNGQVSDISITPVNSTPDSSLSSVINNDYPKENLIDLTQAVKFDNSSITSQQQVNCESVNSNVKILNKFPETQSRFKVVRISSRRKPIMRGRWSCQDFEFDKPNTGQYISHSSMYKTPKVSIPEGTVANGMEEKPTSQDSGSGNSSVVNSIYYIGDDSSNLSIPFGMVYANGHLTLDTILTNPHSSGYSSTAIIRDQNINLDDLYSLVVPDLENNENLFGMSSIQDRSNIPDMSVTENCATTSNYALDDKIAQAMDLVKSHLMFAVHEEVEQLKEQIKELMMRRSELEQENSILRASASPETLAKLNVMISNSNKEAINDSNDFFNNTNDSIICSDATAISSNISNSVFSDNINNVTTTSTTTAAAAAAANTTTTTTNTACTIKLS
ncbi:hypothetical protein HELRODRAFT_189820 [Helobdella robusta]|uniref:Uncharacterized protein n=1 Tax=Helobdella robusta TaxID=6412 RepID=T1FRE2_HELRO|nr:hypothetical protein HELRODRAFT_189820 [Helobdella robusta]ESN91813.1 hypothetical protein HELRODRAFT_189820 [Helobdella robusta]